MVLTLHNMARTYKVLPSEALAKASSFDLYVLDLYSRYVKYQEAQNKGKAPPAPRSITVDKMKAMVERAKNFKSKRQLGAKR